MEMRQGKLWFSFSHPFIEEIGQKWVRGSRLGHLKHRMDAEYCFTLTSAKQKREEKTKGDGVASGK